MLVLSTHKNEKVVLGLLSYTFDQENPSTEILLQLLQRYRDKEEYDLLLYQDDDKDNYVGIIGIEKNQDEYENMTLVIHRLALLPSYRDEDSGYIMYCQLRQMYPQATVIGSMAMSDLVASWTQNYQEEHS